LQYIVIVDSGIHLSDHRPFIANFTFNTQPICTNQPINSVKNTPTKYVWRWDKTNLSDYYEASGGQLSHCSVIDYHCNDNCCNPEHLQAIEDYYAYLTKSLQGASSQTVVKIPSKSFKPYWNDELDRLKEESILWHSI
jgi:hypothetical protein